MLKNVRVETDYTMIQRAGGWPCRCQPRQRRDPAEDGDRAAVLTLSILVCERKHSKLYLPHACLRIKIVTALTTLKKKKRHQVLKKELVNQTLSKTGISALQKPRLE